MGSATPTTNERLPFRADGFASLCEGLDYAARGQTGVNFFSPRGDLQTAMGYGELRERALEMAARLGSTRLRRGDRVALIADTSPEFLIVFFACQYAGMIPVPLPLSINFGGRDAYVERLRGMLMAAGARGAVAPADLLSTLQDAARPTAVTFTATADELMALPMAAAGLRPLGADEPCYIQYSSGSTSFPRGVLVTQQALAANARAIAVDGLALRAGDRCTSWLPLYHDMGLVGCCLTPVMSQIPVDYIATTGFARRPHVWLKLITEMGGTISFSPTFGYELCTRRAANGHRDGYDLSRWRVAGVGGEMVRGKVLNEFAETFGSCGFDKRAFMPSYGMAEATLAVTFPRLGEGMKEDVVARGEALEKQKIARPPEPGDNAARTRSFVVCGSPMPGYAIEIRDDNGRVLPERHVGRICIKGPSLMGGYFRNPEATRAVIKADGWLDSGDMGYLVDGELVVTGRTKDLIIVGGRNIWPQDLEWAVERVEGVRTGDVAAFAVAGEDDRERVVIVVECRRSDAEAQAELRQAVRAAVQRAAGIECEIVLAPPRSLTFTTSGKLSRAAARDSYLTGKIADIGEDIAGETSAPAVEPARVAAAG